MSDMNFQLVLELITKGLEGFNKAVAAEKAAADAGKAANDATIKGAEKATAAIRAETKATEQATAASRAAEAAEKARGQASVEAAGQAASEMEHSISIMQHMRAAAAATGGAMSSAFHKAGAAAAGMGHAIASAGRGAMRGGLGLGHEFARGVGAGIKAELGPIIKNAIAGMWGGMTGYGLMSGPGALRGNVQAMTQAGLARSRMLAQAASVAAYSNVQGAFNIDEQLRPDLGAEGGRAYRAAADAWLVRSAFRRDDVRAALPDAARSGIQPGDRTWTALMDAAASQGMSPQQAMAAYAAAKKGDTSALDVLGIHAAADDAGRLSALSYRANGVDQNVAVAGDIDTKITAALEARFAGGSDRKSMSLEGVIGRSINAWDAFIGKVMDSGPYQFVNQQFEQLFKWMEKAGGAEGVDGFAKKIGTDIVDGLKVAVDLVQWLYSWFKAIKPAADEIAAAVGGWGAILKSIVVAWIAMKAVSFAGWVAGVVSSIIALTAALGPAIASAWAFAAALLANPVTWIVAGVLALAAALYLVWKNWDTIGPALARGWEAIKAAVAAGAAAIGEALSSAWESVKAGAQGAWAFVSNAVATGLAAATGQISEWGSAALTAMQAAFEPVKKWFGLAVDGLTAVWDRVAAAGKSALAYVGLGKDATPAEQQAADQQRAIADAGKASAAIELLTQLQGLLPQVAAGVAGFDLGASITAAINAARAAIGAVSFHAEGVAMMATLAAGIEAGAAKAVAAVHSVAQQMRDHLPHSPAKVGPLSDLDQIRFSETLAAAIRPGPAVDAARAVAAGMREAIAGGPAIGVLKAAGVEGGGAGGASPSGGGSQLTLNFAPVIHGGDAKSIIDQLRPFARELVEMVEAAARQKQRLQFGSA